MMLIQPTKLSKFNMKLKSTISSKKIKFNSIPLKKETIIKLHSKNNLPKNINPLSKESTNLKSNLSINFQKKPSNNSPKRSTTKGSLSPTNSPRNIKPSSMTSKSITKSMSNKNSLSLIENQKPTKKNLPKQKKEELILKYKWTDKNLNYK